MWGSEILKNKILTDKKRLSDTEASESAVGGLSRVNNIYQFINGLNQSFFPFFPFVEQIL